MIKKRNNLLCLVYIIFMSLILGESTSINGCNISITFPDQSVGVLTEMRGPSNNTSSNWNVNAIGKVSVPLGIEIQLDIDTGIFNTDCKFDGVTIDALRFPPCDLDCKSFDDIISSCINVSVITLNGVNMDNACLLSLCRLSKLTTVNIQNSNINRNGLELLTHNKTLKRLYIQGTKIIDNDLELLVGMPSLVHIALPEDITDRGLQFIGELPNLKGLYLVGSKISDTGFMKLERLNKLSLLNLSHTKISDNCSYFLQKQKEIKWLDLSDTQISDAIINTIALMKSLMYLDLSSTEITSDAVRKLKDLPELSSLILRDCQIDILLDDILGFQKLEYCDLTGMKFEVGFSNGQISMTKLRELHIPDASVNALIIGSLLKIKTLNRLLLPIDLDGPVQNLLLRDSWEKGCVDGLWQKKSR